MQITHETLREQGSPGGLAEEAAQSQGFQAGNASRQRQGNEPEWSRRWRGTNQGRVQTGSTHIVGQWRPCLDVRPWRKIYWYENEIKNEPFGVKEVGGSLECKCAAAL